MTDYIKQHRVFPRAFAIFYLFVMYEVVQWVIGLPDVSTGQAAFASTVIAAAAAFMKFYVESGNATE